MKVIKNLEKLDESLNITRCKLLYRVQWLGRQLSAGVSVPGFSIGCQRQFNLSGLGKMSPSVQILGKGRRKTSYGKRTQWRNYRGN
jgi:hypothetical protein